MARPWRSLSYVATERLAEGIDRALTEPVPGGILDRSHEYRLVWDSSRDAWRLDRRSHAERG